MSEMIVWAEPIERGDLRLANSDIGDALAWFKDKTKQEPRLIVLHPSNEHFAEEVGDGVKVAYLGGVLKGEVWLSAEDTFGSESQDIEKATDAKISPFITQPIEIDEKTPKLKKSILNPTNVSMDNFRARGRPTSYKKRPVPNDQIKQLSEQGMGARAIASKLKREKDIVVSYKTIQRILSGERK